MTDNPAPASDNQPIPTPPQQDVSTPPPPVAVTPPAPPQYSVPKAHWTVWHGVVIIAAIVVILVLGLVVLVPNAPSNRLPNWLLIIMVMVFSFGVISQAITGEWRGLLIDSRNKISLSRMQMALWTILILSGLITAALSNVRLSASSANQLLSGPSVQSPLNVDIPPETYLLMGISTTSLVASPLLKSIKADQTPDQTQADTMTSLVAQQHDISADQVTNNGLIVANTTPKAARWSDLFQGEEVGNAAQLDLAKIQMFYFTIILIVGYGAALGALFLGNAAITSFPPISSGMVSLLGISHAGYLANKAIPHN